jgi:hypothetical protein
MACVEVDFGWIRPALAGLVSPDGGLVTSRPRAGGLPCALADVLEVDADFGLADLADLAGLLGLADFWCAGDLREGLLAMMARAALR